MFVYKVYNKSFYHKSGVVLHVSACVWIDPMLAELVFRKYKSAFAFYNIPQYSNTTCLVLLLKLIHEKGMNIPTSQTHYHGW